MHAGTKEPMGEKNKRNLQTRKQKSGQRQENSGEITRETLNAARNGDEEAFEELYERSYPKVSVTVKSVIKNQESAEDVIQESYIRIFQGLKKVRSAAGFVAWACRIAHNCAVNYMRKWREEIPISELCDMSGEDVDVISGKIEDRRDTCLPEKAAEQAEERIILRNILYTLPEEQRTAAVLYYMEELSVKEIAVYLGVPQNTVKSRLYYARKKIRRGVEDQEKRGFQLRALPPFAFLASLLCGKTHAEAKKAMGATAKGGLRRFAAVTVALCVVAGTASYSQKNEQNITPDYAYVEEDEETQEEETRGKEEETESVTEADAEEETEAEAESYANVLSSIRDENNFATNRSLDYYFDFDTIRTVTFLNQMDAAPDDAADVSYAHDGTVAAWVTEAEDGLCDMYIAASGAVIAPEDSRELFLNMTNLVSIDFGGNFDTSRATTMFYMFRGCSSLRELDLSGFDTSGVTDMSSMFAECTSLTSLILGDFDTSSAVTLEAMFYNCSSLKSLDVSSFDTSQVEVFDLLFAYCASLEEIDVSGFDTANGTTYWQMFCGCESLTGLDLTAFDTANAENMGEMFALCYALEHVDVSSFDTSNVTSMSGMFFKCTSLTELDLRNFDTSRVEDMSYMFSRSTALLFVDIAEFETESLTNITHMFFDTPDALKDEFRSWAEAIDAGQLLEAEEVFGSEEE